jgi:hypothetical protein
LGGECEIADQYQYNDHEGDCLPVVQGARQATEEMRLRRGDCNASQQIVHEGFVGFGGAPDTPDVSVRGDKLRQGMRLVSDRC